MPISNKIKDELIPGIIIPNDKTPPLMRRVIILSYDADGFSITAPEITIPIQKVISIGRR